MRKCEAKNAKMRNCEKCEIAKTAKLIGGQKKNQLNRHFWWVRRVPVLVLRMSVKFQRWPLTSSTRGVIPLTKFVLSRLAAKEKLFIERSKYVLLAFLYLSQGQSLPPSQERSASKTLNSGFVPLLWTTIIATLSAEVIVTDLENDVEEIVDDQNKQALLPMETVKESSKR